MREGMIETGGETMLSDRYLTDKPVVVRDPYLERHLNRLEAAIPVAGLHRRALRLLGSDFVYASSDRRMPGSWISMVRFGGLIERTFGITREVIAYYSPHGDLQQRTFDRITAAEEEVRRAATPDLYLVSTPDPRAAERLEDWTRSKSFVIVVLPQKGTEDEVATGLLDAITAQLTTRDRYDETLPVIGSDFFGRQALITSLTDYLRAGKVCGVFGLRKTGKTSLVKELGRRFVKDDEQNRLFVLRDLETLSSNVEHHETGLINDLRVSFLEELRKRKLRTHELVQLPSHPSISDFRRALHVVLRRSQNAGVQVVLALDEVESLIGTAEAITHDVRPEVPEFLGAMRSLVQENENFNVMLVGLTSAVLERGELYGRENPLFSWAKAFYLPPLGRTEANNLTVRLGQRMAVRWDDSALDALFGESGGNVFLHRALASHIVGKLPHDPALRLVSIDNVQTSIRPWRRSVAVRVKEMLDATARYYPDECTLLALLADDMTAAAEFERANPAIIEHLLQLGLLVESPDGFELGPLSRLHYGG
jgi:ATPase domain predominantly from Archaea